MSTQFTNSFVNGDVIEATHVKQSLQPIQSLESGKALYREASSSGANFVVDFQETAIPNGAPGHVISALSAGQMVVFKADADSLASAQLEVSLEGGGSASAPLHLADTQVGAGEIKANQIVVAIYNDTTTPRFDVVGLGGSGTGGGVGLSPGDLLYSFRTNPAGYVEANGQLVSQSVYPDLFAEVGLIANLTAWLQETTSTFADITDAAFGNSVFVAVGNQSTILTSSNGSTWTQQTSPVSEDFSSVTFGGGLFVAVGTNGAILTSPDGSTWSVQTSATSESLTDVCYGASLFVLVGSNGAILTSANGTSWTTQTSPSGQYLFGVTYGAGLFIAVGLSGTVWSSSNGTSWSVETTPNSYIPLNAVTHANGKFITVGASATIWTSPDGSSWTAESAPGYSELRAVGYADGKFLAVGASLTILTSSDGSAWKKSLSSGYTSLSGMASDGAGLTILSGNSGAILSNTADPYSYDEATEFLLPSITSANEGMKAWLKI